MYRPNIRMDDTFKEWVDGLFTGTRLDRNQIIRLALFSAWESPNFRREMEAAKTSQAPLPLPTWKVSEAWLWKKQTVKKGEGGRGANGLETRDNGGTGGKASAGVRVLQPTSDGQKREDARPSGKVHDGGRGRGRGNTADVYRENGGIRVVIR